MAGKPFCCYCLQNAFWMSPLLNTVFSGGNTVGVYALFCFRKFRYLLLLRHLPTLPCSLSNSGSQVVFFWDMVSCSVDWSHTWSVAKEELNFWSFFLQLPNSGQMSLHTALYLEVGWIVEGTVHLLSGYGPCLWFSLCRVLAFYKEGVRFGVSWLIFGRLKGGSASVWLVRIMTARSGMGSLAMSF